jgi:hypothetical protein
MGSLKQEETKHKCLNAKSAARFGQIRVLCVKFSKSEVG